MPHPQEDYYGWAVETARQLKARQFNAVDIDALIEELEAMARKERRALKNRLAVLLAHLLKCHVQPAKRSPSWEGTLNEQRRKLHGLLDDSPSLKPEVAGWIDKAYPQAIDRAMKDTNFPRDRFPASFTETGWTLEQVLDLDFYPS